MRAEQGKQENRAESPRTPDQTVGQAAHSPMPKAIPTVVGREDSFTETEKHEIRYKTLMEIMVNYSDFFKQLKLDRKKTEALAEVMVDQKLRYFEAPFQISGRDSAQPTVEELTAFGVKNNKLIQDLIGEVGLDALTAHEIQVERKDDVDRALNEIEKQNVILSPAAQSSLTSALLNTKSSGIVGDAYVENKPLTPERSAAIKNALDREYQAIRVQVQQRQATPADLAALDLWHDRKVAEALQNIARAYRAYHKVEGDKP